LTFGNQCLDLERARKDGPAWPSSCGFTLVELVLAIVLIALISSFAAIRFESLFGWKAEGELRKFAETWQFLFNEAYGRGDSYRIVVNLDQNSYYVRREVIPRGLIVRQVDYLANFRTKSEKARRAKKEEEELLSIEEELAEEDLRQGGALDELFYETMFADPFSPKRLARPVEFPSLAEQRTLPPGLIFRSVTLHGERIESGQAFLRLSPRGSAEFAAVVLQAGEQLYTVVINPATGKVSVQPGERDFTEGYAELVTGTR